MSENTKQREDFESFLNVDPRAKRLIVWDGDRYTLDPIESAWLTWQYLDLRIAELQTRLGERNLDVERLEFALSSGHAETIEKLKNAERQLASANLALSGKTNYCEQCAEMGRKLDDLCKRLKACRNELSERDAVDAEAEACALKTPEEVYQIARCDIRLDKQEESALKQVIDSAYRLGLRESKRQLDALQALLPVDEIDDIRGHHCCCIYSDVTAERLQVCGVHSRLESQLAERDAIDAEADACEIKTPEHVYEMARCDIRLDNQEGMAIRNVIDNAYQLGVRESERQNRELREYVYHKATCSTNHLDKDKRDACDCGLHKALGQEVKP